jgi:hypothetical protein
MNGLAVLSFSKRMTVPALDTLTPSAILPEISPGYFSDSSKLNFTYSFPSFTPTRLLLQLHFEDPLFVSNAFASDPDLLKVTFREPMLFFDYQG